jgi:hypothetical protein
MKDDPKTNEDVREDFLADPCTTNGGGLDTAAQKRLTEMLERDNKPS